MTDIILRDCGKVGWLAIVEVDGTEVYRGEHQKHALMAGVKAVSWLEDNTCQKPS